jgi:hypothetical protein
MISDCLGKLGDETLIFVKERELRVKIVEIWNPPAHDDTDECLVECPQNNIAYTARFLVDLLACQGTLSRSH